MRIVLCGDICPTQATESAFEAGDCHALLGSALETIRGADLAVANLECALTQEENAIRKCGPNLKGKPEWAEVLARCGLTHMGLSNNHVMDFGLQGLRDTAQALDQAGIVWFGMGENDRDSRKPLLMECGGITIAIVAVCEHEYSYALPDQMGANPFDPFDTMEDIASAKEKADWLVVMYHGGKEQCEYPSPRLRKACQAMVRAGADLVVCQHSHCLGCEETYRQGRIVYGMGNFLFVSHPDHRHWQYGSMITIDLNDREATVELHPVVTTGNGITLAQGEERQRLLAEYEQHSRILQKEEAWLQAWRTFCEQQMHYCDAVRDAMKEIPQGDACAQIFAHYLDCEAHLDVWQTLFPTWHRNKTSNA